ncbi:MAG: SRPBCC domain-containing protein [Gammaproteobacteria bacterium]|nr:SRPBCC domain-containing protein [Gammaproteobacteria bacterium]
MTIRSIEKELWIDAAPEDVWRAFTDAQEIVNWFAPRAESQPGVGGYIELAWDLKAVQPSRCHILEWRPHAHLLMTWRDAPGGEHELPVELTLAKQDGGTLLRLVHSGFLSDASWDEEYESHGRGWSYELRSLKYYVEHHFGRARQLVMERLPVSGDGKAAWQAIVGPSGAFRVLDGLAEGAEFVLGLPTGETTSAELMFAVKDRDFVATVSMLQGGLFRLALELISGVPEVWIWAFSWQLSDAELKTLTLPIFEAIRERLSAGSLSLPK